MERKVLIREIEVPDLLVEINGERYRLLCEFQSKDGSFPRVFLREGGNEVVVAKGKNSAVVGLFSVADGNAGKLFDYIEASLAGKDGFVCWQSGEMEKLLDIAIEAGDKYPMIQAGLGLIDKAPVFYLQKRLDREFQSAIEKHTIKVEYVVDEVDMDMDEEAFPYEFDEELDSEPKISQAMFLPEGWAWNDYDDLSGSLVAPDGKHWFEYGVNKAGWVEYRRDSDVQWANYSGDLQEFKCLAEKTICEHVLTGDERERSMEELGKMRFYVIDDKRNQVGITPFDGVAEAYERFREVCKFKNWMPALGVQVGDGMIDLLHGVNGEPVLVPDYRYTDNFSEPMLERLEDIKAAVEWLVLEGGGISYEYSHDILPMWMQGSVNTLVPVTLGESYLSSYCKDKVLKTTNRWGQDAIDSLYLEMHGWVAYDELLKHPDEYVADGTIKVQYLNVNYVREQNVVGIDGQMDVSPCEFKEMVEQINKPYALLARDGAKYTGSFLDKHEFIVASFNTAQEAVRGWYEVQERKRVPLLVQSYVPGEQCVVFNGFAEDGVPLNIEDAAKTFGFEVDSGLDEMIARVTERCEVTEKGKITFSGEKDHGFAKDFFS